MSEESLTTKTSIKSLLESKQKQLRNKLQTVISHPTSKGSHGEKAWINFFRSFLPSKYAVDKGFVFDSNGKLSDQIDIIIYDSLYTPLIFETEDGEKYITVESVYMIFEAKQAINKENLNYTHNKIKSVQNLHRSSRGMIVAGKSVQARELTPILGGILASTSISKQSVEKHLMLYDTINLGCAIHNFSFLVNKETREMEINSLDDNEVILSFFFIILDELFKLGTCGAIDIRKYANFSLKGNNFKIESD
jgi:hypothetical protein